MAKRPYDILAYAFKTRAKISSKSLYEKIGGEPAVEEVVEGFYRDVLNDELVRDYFGGVCMHYQRYKLRVFLTMVLGGPVKYTGKDLRTAHARLVERGLTDVHFDRILTHLRATLERLNLGQEEIAATMAVTESTRNDVLNR